LSTGNEETAGNDSVSVFALERLVVLGSFKELLSCLDDVASESQWTTDGLNTLVCLLQILIGLVVSQLSMRSVEFSAPLASITKRDRRLELWAV